MAITKIRAGALPADVITTAAIDDASITHAKLHTTMDLSSKTVTLPTLSTLNTTGNVGIGTNSPLRKIHISDAGDTHLVLQSTNATNDYEIFEMGVGANSNSKVDLTFRTRNNSGTGGSEVMRLSNDGDVHLNSGVDARIQLGTSGTGATSVSDNSVYVRGNDDNLILGAAGNGNIFFKENAATHMTIEPGGNVGIGTANPSTKLHVNGNIRASTLYQEGGDSASSAMVVSQGVNTTRASVALWSKDHGSYPGQVHIVSHSANASADSGKIMFWDYNGSAWNANGAWDKDGKLGIGTTSPEFKLEVFRPTGNLARVITQDDNNGATNPLSINYNASFRIDNQYSGAAPSANGTKVGKLQLSTVTTSGYGAYGAIIVDADTGTGYDSGEMSFALGANSSNLMTERMRLSSDGSLLINRTSNLAGSKLLVKGTKGGIGGSNGMLTIVDDQAYNVSDNGGSIGFAGDFYSGGQVVFATISGIKANNTDGNNAGELNFYTRQSSGDLRRGMTLNSDRHLSVVGNINSEGYMYANNNIFFSTIFTFNGGGTQTIFTVPGNSSHLVTTRAANYGSTDDRHGKLYLLNRHGSRPPEIVLLAETDGTGGISISGNDLTYSAGGGNPYTQIYFLRLA